MLKQTNELLTDLREKIERVTSVFSFLKSDMVSAGVKGLIGLVSSVKNRKSKPKKTKTKK